MRPHWQRGQQPGERAGVYEVADRYPRADAIVSGMLKRRAPDSKPFRRGVYRSMGSRWRDLTLNAGAGATTVVMEHRRSVWGWRRW